MIVKADFGRRIGTLAERKNSIQKSLNLIGRSHVWIGTKIETAILFDLARDDEARIALIGNLDEGIGLVVLEHDIVLGLVLLDEVDLKKQGFNIGLSDDKLKIHNLRYQGFRLGVVAPSKIGPHSIAKILGLPHIDDGTVFIFVNVTARTRRQELELGFNQVVHTLYYSKKESGTEMSRAVKADEISVVEPTQPLRLARQSKKIERLGLLSQPLDINSLLSKEVRT